MKYPIVADHCTDIPLKVSKNTLMSGNVQTGVQLTYMSFSFVQNADANVVMSLECSVSFVISMKKDNLRVYTTLHHYFIKTFLEY